MSELNTRRTNARGRARAYSVQAPGLGRITKISETAVKNSAQAAISSRLNTPSPLGGRRPSHLRTIQEEVVQTTPVPKPEQQDAEPEPLRHACGAVQARPVAPHPKPEKEEGQRARHHNESQRDPDRKGHPRRVCRAQPDRGYGEHKDHGSQEPSNRLAAAEPVIAGPVQRPEERWKKWHQPSLLSLFPRSVGCCNPGHRCRQEFLIVAEHLADRLRVTDHRRRGRVV